MPDENGGESPSDQDEESTVTDEPLSEEETPLSSLRERLEARNAAAGEDGDGGRDELLADLAAEANESTEAERAELFEEVDVGDVDAEAVWDAVVEEGKPPEEALGGTAEPEGTAEPTGTPDEHVINKREYCQRCEYFSEPPTVGCTHEGTEIIELVDSDTFRVRNCPKVGENEDELRSMIENEQP